MIRWNRRRFLTLALPVLAGARASAEPAPPAKPLRFGVIADPQYADVPAAGTRHYRASLKKLEACIAELNRHDLAFTLTLGDLIDRDFASFDPVLACYSKLRSPHRLVPGNHDFSVTDAEKPQVLGKLGLPQAHQSFTSGGWRLILIDGTEVATYRHPADDPRTGQAQEMLARLTAEKQPQAQPWNGGISKTQLEWLETELTAARAARQRVILAGHYPLVPANDPHRLWNADEVTQLIGRYPEVAAYLNGHNHQGSYTHAGHCHYVNFKGMVETAADNPFAIVTCHPDHLHIDGFGPEPARDRLD